MGEASLREAVEKQARARVEGDMAAFASYMTPQALIQIRNGHERLRRFSILSVTEDGDTGISAVQYQGGGSHVLRQQWERRNGGWTAFHAERPASEQRPPLWRRLLRFG